MQLFVRIISCFASRITARPQFNNFSEGDQMAENSKIGWTDNTMNFWWGCDKVSKECRLCYIGPIMRRSGREPFNGPIRTSEANWKNPAKWNRLAQDAGKRLLIFTCSMSDFFHKGADNWRSDADRKSTR